MLNTRNGYYKIGYSIQPKYREQTLQSQEPEIEMVFNTPGNRSDEAAWHRRFKANAYVVNGFALTAADVQDNSRLVSHTTTRVTGKGLEWMAYRYQKAA